VDTSRIAPKEPLDDQPSRRSRRSLWVVLGAVAVATVIAVFISFAFWLPPRMVDTGVVDASTLTASDRVNLEMGRLKAINDVRSSLLTGLGILVTAVGAAAVFFGGLVAYLNYRETEHQNREALALQERGQITERFARAIEQIGSEKLDVRMGGIYALEQIARDPPVTLHGPVMEILTAFVRAHAHRDGGQTAVPSAPLRADFQATLAVLGRRRVDRDGNSLNLQGVDLHGLHLGADAHLERAVLIAAHLEGADLTEAHFTEADLSRAYLIGAQLVRTRLDSANLAGIDLRGAILNDAHLERAKLAGAQLQGAQLLRTRLKGANLQHALLDGANLSGADLESAEFQGASLTGARLVDTHGLTHEQLESAVTDEWTWLPDDLTEHANGI
jgi:hypothetical protein